MSREEFLPEGDIESVVNDDGDEERMWFNVFDQRDGSLFLKETTLKSRDNLLYNAFRLDQNALTYNLQQNQGFQLPHSICQQTFAKHKKKVTDKFFPNFKSGIKISKNDFNNLKIYFERDEKNGDGFQFFLKNIRNSKNFQNKYHEVFRLLATLFYIADKKFSQELSYFINYLYVNDRKGFEQLRHVVKKNAMPLFNDIPALKELVRNTCFLCHQAQGDEQGILKFFAEDDRSLTGYKKMEFLARFWLPHAVPELARHLADPQKNNYDQKKAEVARYFINTVTKEEEQLNRLALKRLDLDGGFGLNSLVKNLRLNEDSRSLRAVCSTEEELQQYFAAYQGAVKKCDRRAPLMLVGDKGVIVVEYIAATHRWVITDRGERTKYQDTNAVDKAKCFAKIIVFLRMQGAQDGKMLLLAKPFAGEDHETRLNPAAVVSQWQSALPARPAANTGDFLRELETFYLNKKLWCQAGKSSGMIYSRMHTSLSRTVNAGNNKPQQMREVTKQLKGFNKMVGTVYGGKPKTMSQKKRVVAQFCRTSPFSWFNRHPKWSSKGRFLLYWLLRLSLTAVIGIYQVPIGIIRGAIVGIYKEVVEWGLITVMLGFAIGGLFAGPAGATIGMVIGALLPTGIGALNGGKNGLKESYQLSGRLLGPRSNFQSASSMFREANYQLCQQEEQHLGRESTEALLAKQLKQRFDQLNPIKKLKDVDNSDSQQQLAAAQIV